MLIFLSIVSVTLVLSLAFNLVLLLKSKSQKLKEAYDARMLLHDLTAGDALVRVTRIAPEDVLLRSPRDL